MDGVQEAQAHKAPRLEPKGLGKSMQVKNSSAAHPQAGDSPPAHGTHHCDHTEQGAYYTSTRGFMATCRFSYPFLSGIAI